MPSAPAWSSQDRNSLERAGKLLTTPGSCFHSGWAAVAGTSSHTPVLSLQHPDLLRGSAAATCGLPTSWGSARFSNARARTQTHRGCRFAGRKARLVFLFPLPAMAWPPVASLKADRTGRDTGGKGSLGGRHGACPPRAGPGAPSPGRSWDPQASPLRALYWVPAHRGPVSS